MRCGNVYGHGSCLRFDAVINRFMFEAHYYNRISIAGSGRQYRSFIHIDMISDALSQLAFLEIPSGIYNLTHMNLSVEEIRNSLKNIYPGLEVLYIEQDLQLRSLLVEQNPILKNKINHTPLLLDDQLKEFKSMFSFPGKKEPVKSIP